MNTSRDYWDSCIEAGRMAYEKGSYAEADMILKRTVDKYETNAKKEVFAFSDLLLVSARVKREMNQFDDALSLYYRALSNLNAKHKGDRMLIARILVEIAFCMILLGRFSSAREKEKCALLMIDELFGPDSKEADDCVVRLACLNWIIGDIDSASVYLERHLRFCKKQGMGNEGLYAPLATLARIHYRSGNFSQAEDYFKEAQTHVRDSERHARESTALGNELGMSICAQGRHQEARAICQASSLEREKMADSKPLLSTPESINDLADVYCAMGDFDSAKQLCESAEALRWEAPKEDMRACLALYSRMLKYLNVPEITNRIDRRVRELPKPSQ